MGRKFGKIFNNSLNKIWNDHVDECNEWRKKEPVLYSEEWIKWIHQRDELSDSFNERLKKQERSSLIISAVILSFSLVLVFIWPIAGTIGIFILCLWFLFAVIGVHIRPKEFDKP